MSAERPDTPSSPDRVLSQPSTSSGETSSLRARKPTSDGSKSPDLVPMISPSSGVNPIEVSTDRPPSTAVAEQPAPSCNVISFTSSTGLAVISEKRSTM